MASSSRASCDACKYRKVRCDRRDRLDAGASACSECAKRRMACQVSEDDEKLSRTLNSQPTVKLGKRMRTLMDAADSVRRDEALIEAHVPSRASSISSSSLSPYTPPSAESSSKAMLLGVEGLTRLRLDRLVDAFFDSVGRYFPIYYSKQEFKLRYGARLDLNAGLQPSVDRQPTCDLLILAVACRGANALQQHGLVERIEHRFCTLAADGDALLLAGLDGVEAVNLLSEREVRPIHPLVDIPGRQQKIEQCLRIDPLGRGYGIELAIQNGVHLGPTGQSDDDRRRTIFWTVYMLDAIRSLSARRMYRIHDEDVGWPPRGSDPTATQTSYGSTMFAIAVLSRRLCRSLFSARARLTGITAEEIVDLLGKLDAWPVDHEVSTFFSRPDAESSAQHAAAKMMWLSMYLALVCSISTDTSAAPADNLTAIAHGRLHDATLRACLEASKVAQQCTVHGLVHAAPNVLRNITAAWGLWCARTIAAGRSAKEISSSTVRKHFQDIWNAAYVFIDCVRSDKRTPQSGLLADSLESSLLKAVDLSDEALREQMSGSSSGQSDLGGIPANRGETDILALADVGLLNGGGAGKGKEWAGETDAGAIQQRGITGHIAPIRSANGALPSAAPEAESQMTDQHQYLIDDATAALGTAWQAWQALDNDVYQLLADAGFEMPLSSCPTQYGTVL